MVGWSTPLDGKEPIMPRRTLTLTDAQRAELFAVRDHERRPYLRERAAALLRVAAGESPPAAARRGIRKPGPPVPPDATKLGWITRAVERAERDPAQHVVIWGDEASVDRQPTLADHYFPLGEESTIDLSHKANIRFRIGGGLNHCTGATTDTTG